MKKLSEVCKIVGVTRRTLQEYDKIGLLHPTTKTEAGYWLYDDLAIQLLFLIQIFIETGYERKTVKRLLEDPTMDIISELDNMISTLEGKRRRIDGIINTIKMIKYAELLPENTITALGKMDMKNVFKEKSFSDYWNETVDRASSYSSKDITETEMYIPFWNQLVAIGLLHDRPVDDAEVVECVKLFCDCLLDIVLTDVESNDVEIADIIMSSEISEAINEAIGDMLSEPVMTEMIETQCGKHTAAFIIEAISEYCNSITDLDNEKWRARIEEIRHSKCG